MGPFFLEPWSHEILDASLRYIPVNKFSPTIARIWFSVTLVQNRKQFLNCDPAKSVVWVEEIRKENHLLLLIKYVQYYSINCLIPVTKQQATVDGREIQ